MEANPAARARAAHPSGFDAGGGPPCPSRHSIGSKLISYILIAMHVTGIPRLVSLREILLRSSTDIRAPTGIKSDLRFIHEIRTSGDQGLPLLVPRQ